MPITRQQVEEALKKIPEDQQMAFLTEVRRRMKAGDQEFSPYFAGGKKPIPKPQAIPGYPYSPPNPIADVTAAGMAGTAGILAAPMLAGSTLGGIAVSEATEQGLKKLGVPEPVADVAGEATGFAGGGGGLLRMAMKRGLGAKAKKMILDFAEGFTKRKAQKELGKKAVKETGEEMVEVAGKKFAPEVMTEMGQMMDKARFLKTGLSDAQTVDALKSLYGLTNKQAKDLLKLAVGS